MLTLAASSGTVGQDHLANYRWFGGCRNRGEGESQFCPFLDSISMMNIERRQAGRGRVRSLRSPSSSSVRVRGPLNRMTDVRTSGPQMEGTHLGAEHRTTTSTHRHGGHGRGLLYGRAAILESAGLLGCGGFSRSGSRWAHVSQYCSSC